MLAFLFQGLKIEKEGFVYVEFHSAETVMANMALYTDRAFHFNTTRHGGLHLEVKQKETQRVV